MPEFGIDSFQRRLQRGLRVSGLIALSVGLVSGGSVLPFQSAGAQSYLGAGDVSPSKRKKQRQSAERDKAKRSAEKSRKDETPTEIKGPLVVSVSLSRQRLTVYDANSRAIAVSPISSGKVGHSTPTGVFSVVQKRRQHFSNLYAGASMPNMQRLTWSGVALHAGALPGYPASHGCIRLPHGFSKKLFGMTKMGTRVIVSRDPVSPVPIAHERLFAAYPSEMDLVTRDPQGETQVADASLAAGTTTEGVSAVLGVTAAVAAEVETTDSPRARFLARRQAEKAVLDGEIRAAGYERATREAELAAAHRASEAVREPMIEARAEAQRIEDELAQRERSLASAERELEDLTAPRSERPKRKESEKRKRKDERKADDGSKRIAKIAALKERVARLPGEIDVLRSDLVRANEVKAAAEHVAEEAESKRRAALKAYNEVNAVLKTALAKEESARKLELRRDLPVSVFISRAKQRLYVRLGYDDIFDTEVTFDRPEEPIGTHVFTALDFAPEAQRMTWNVASIAHDPTRAKAKKSASKDKSKRKAAEQEAPAPSLAGQTASAALDRITIPDDAREQIADVMKPGSSIVISDFALSNETGKYTDFIAQIR